MYENTVMATKGIDKSVQSAGAAEARAGKNLVIADVCVWGEGGAQGLCCHCYRLGSLAGSLVEAKSGFCPLLSLIQ